MTAKDASFAPWCNQRWQWHQRVAKRLRRDMSRPWYNNTTKNVVLSTLRLIAVNAKKLWSPYYCNINCLRDSVGNNSRLAIAIQNARVARWAILVALLLQYKIFTWLGGQ